MTARGSDSLTWDGENRLSSMTVGGTTTSLTYDGDGVRVEKTVGGTTTYYVGNWYEKTGNEATKYYYHGGRLVALRKGDTLYYLHLDHLGSTMLTTDTGDPPDRAAEQRFYPWGQATRYTYGTQQTEFNFTGQRLDDSTDLLYYGARYYDPALRRWVQPDTLVPDPGNPQDLNRYAYVRNSPVRYTDPTGYWTFEETPDEGEWRPPAWPYPAIRSVSEPPEPPLLGPALEILDRYPTGRPIVDFAMNHDIVVVFWPSSNGMAVWNVVFLPYEYKNPHLMRISALHVAHELFHVMQHAEGGFGLPYPLSNEVQAYIVQETIAWEEGLKMTPKANLENLTGAPSAQYGHVMERGLAKVGPVEFSIYETPLFVTGRSGSPLTAVGHILGRPSFSAYVRYTILGDRAVFVPFVE